MQLDDKQLAHHREHKDWLKQLDFYESEIQFFKLELNNVVLKNMESYSKLEYVDEYKAIFKKKIGHIDEMRTDIALHEKKLSTEDIEKHDDSNHMALKIKLEAFIARFEDLKSKFKRFASHND